MCVCRMEKKRCDGQVDVIEWTWDVPSFKLVAHLSKPNGNLIFGSQDTFQFFHFFLSPQI